MSSSTRRDADRARVYLAEEVAFEGTLAGTPVPWPQLERFVADVLAALSRAGSPVGPVELRRTRPDAGRSTAQATGAAGAGGVVRVAPGHEAPATATHELAHLLAPGEGHGAAFRRAHLTVAAVGFGARGVAVLGAAYAGGGLPIAPPAPRTVGVPALEGWGLLQALLSGARPAGPVGARPVR